MSNDNLFGHMVISTFVRVPSTDGGRSKRVRLHAVYCNRSDCDEYMEAFRRENPEFGKSRIIAEFKFEETL